MFLVLSPLFGVHNEWKHGRLMKNWVTFGSVICQFFAQMWWELLAKKSIWDEQCDCKTGWPMPVHNDLHVSLQKCLL